MPQTTANIGVAPGAFLLFQKITCLLPWTRDYRTYFINGHVCDGGDFGPVLGASDGVWSFQIRSEQQQNGSKSPRPEGLQPKSASALLLGLLDVPHRAARRASASFWLATHHASIDEIGSGIDCGDGENASGF